MLIFSIRNFQDIIEESRGEELKRIVIVLERVRFFQCKVFFKDTRRGKSPQMKL